jgi:NAD(P)-dependent dehydrogenase (short-subunit alcohol dehydrogenase family)
MDMRLKDKVAIVTGAGTGIGKATSLRFGREGAALVLFGLRQTPLATVAQEIEAAGGRAIAVPGDVGQQQDVIRSVSAAVAHFGGLDILVNNAAISVTRNLMDLSRTEWDRVLSANLTGQFLMAQAAAPEMRKRGGGSIVNISSVQEKISEPQAIAYSCSKGGVAQLTRSLALELGAFNIVANAIAPGFVGNTQMSMTDGVDETTTDKFRTYYVNSGRIPLGRAGTIDDIAAAAVFLASRECDYLTGASLVADGGLSLTL